MARSCHERVKLSKRSRCTVSRISEEFFSCFESLLIHMDKCCPTHHDFPTDFHPLSLFECWYFFRQILYLKCRRSDILPLYPASSRDRLIKLPVAIYHRKPESIVLWLYIVRKYFYCFVIASLRSNPVIIRNFFICWIASFLAMTETFSFRQYL